MSRQQLQNEIAELQKQLEEKQKALAAMPDKWEPKGGWCIDVEGDILTCDEGLFADFGNCFKSYEQAEKAAKAMRAHNRLLAWVSEHVTCGWEADWSDYQQCKYYVFFDHGTQIWNYQYYCQAQNIGIVVMPRYAAVELCRKLNSGEVEL